MTVCITTVSIVELIATISRNDTQHNDCLHYNSQHSELNWNSRHNLMISNAYSVVILNVAILNVIVKLCWNATNLCCCKCCKNFNPALVVIIRKNSKILKCFNHSKFFCEKIKKKLKSQIRVQELSLLYSVKHIILQLYLVRNHLKIFRRHDTQNNDTQYNDIQHNNK
jgi:hypothetical protein